MTDTVTIQQLIAELRQLQRQHGDLGTAAFLLQQPIEQLHKLAPCQCGTTP